MSQKKVANIGPFQQLFPAAVQKGSLITLTGHVSVTDEAAPRDPGDLLAQIRNIYADVAKTLEAMGATMNDVVDETWFVTDAGDLMANLEPIFAARAKAYGSERPDVAQTCVQVAALVMPELVIEMKLVAVVD